MTFDRDAMPDSVRDTADAINALHQAATPGEWRYNVPSPGGYGGIWSGPHGAPNVFVTANADPDDLALIVAVHNAWPAIYARLGEADAIEAEIAELRGAVAVAASCESEWEQRLFEMDPA
jgi:hypothetical protein